jgi:serine/threonine protein kinase
LRFLSDTTVDHLRVVAELPDFEGTRYEVDHELGRGGMGVVYLANDKALNREVAIKVLNSTLLSSSMAQRMLREATVIARLEHPGIVPVHDAGTLADGRVFYVMKLVRGNSLSGEIQRLHSLQDRLRIFLKACEAVAFAHANGVVHRDLKPDNIMLGPFGEVLVMDWGTAKLLRAPEPVVEDVNEGPVETSVQNQTDHGIIIGTPDYMSPEQASGLGQIDGRADVYSLGAVLRFLFSKSDLDKRSVPESALRRLRAITDKAMAVEPGERYATVEELANDVSRFLDSEPISAYRENLAEKLVRWLGRHRFIVLLILAYLLMRVLLLFVSSN